jgi:hypothetical protein
LRKKSGSSSGGIIRRGGLLPFPDLLGLPITNQRIAAIGGIGTKNIPNKYAHFGPLRIFSCGVTAQSTKA